jgi:hypothetical protein
MAVSRKLDGFLTNLLFAHSSALAGSRENFALPGSIHGAYVTIDAVAADGDGAKLLSELRRLGLTHGAFYGGMASGEMPIAKLGTLTRLADLGFAQEDSLVTNKLSPLPPQDATALQSTEAGIAVKTHGGQTFTIDGTGVTVGIISDSFNTLGHRETMKTDIAKGLLPADTHVLQDYPHGSDEGRAIGQLVHEIAPGASILFATAYYGEASFAANIIRLAEAGAKVIIDDVGYYDEPAYQDGVIAQAVDYVASHYGVTYLSAAGNDGGNGYEGAFTPGFHRNGRVFDNFTPGQRPHWFLPVAVPAHDDVVFILEWAQPAASASPGHGAASELDLILANGSRGAISRSASHTIGHDPFQGIEFINNLAHTRVMYLGVALKAGPVPADFKLMALDDGAGVVLGSYSSNINHGTIYGHPAAAGAVSIGADFFGSTPAYGTSPPQSEPYSSLGPTMIYFQPNGLPYPTPLERGGPGLMAPDGADTTFLGFQISDGDKLPNFFGTSAAVAAAGAVDALVREADPLLTAAQGIDILQATSIPQPDSVAGLINADTAVNLAWDLFT